MPRPYVFSSDTTLYHPTEGERVFPAGETDPGAAWSDKPGGDPVGTNAAVGALKDLIEANDRLDQMGQMAAQKDHDLAVMAKERDEAAGKVAELEQRAIAAEKAQAEAEEATHGYMVERDQARSELKAAQDKLAASESAHTEKVEGLVKQIDDANQMIADASTEIEGLKAEIAKVDQDGDGRVGGSKASKKPAEPAPDAEKPAAA